MFGGLPMHGNMGVGLTGGAGGRGRAGGGRPGHSCPKGDRGLAVEVLSEIVMARPRAEVAAYAVDPDKRPPSGTRASRRSSGSRPRPLAIGTKLAFVASFLGRRLAYTYEVIEHLPGDRFVMSTAHGPSDGDHLHLGRGRPPRDEDDASLPPASCSVGGGRLGAQTGRGGVESSGRAAAD
jgi:hypothetical protein